MRESERERERVIQKRNEMQQASPNAMTTTTCQDSLLSSLSIHSSSCDSRRLLSKLHSISPFQVLREKSTEFKLSISSPEFARKLDQEDHLASFRDQFCIPTTTQLPYGECLHFIICSFPNANKFTLLFGH